MTEAEIKAAMKTLLDQSIPTITKTITDALAAQNAEAMKPLTESLAAITARLETVEKAKPDAGKPDPKAGDKPAPDSDPAATGVLAQMQELLKPLQEQLGAITTERQTQAEQAKTRALAEATLAAKFPNLKGKARERALARILATKPADEAGVVKVIDEYRAELADIGGVDVTPFSAVAAKEGATPGASVDPKQARREEIRGMARAAANPLAGITSGAPQLVATA